MSTLLSQNKQIQIVKWFTQDNRTPPHQKWIIDSQFLPHKGKHAVSKGHFLNRSKGIAILSLTLQALRKSATCYKFISQHCLLQRILVEKMAKLGGWESIYPFPLLSHTHPTPLKPNVFGIQNFSDFRKYSACSIYWILLQQGLRQQLLIKYINISAMKYMNIHFSKFSEFGNKNKGL